MSDMGYKLFDGLDFSEMIFKGKHVHQKCPVMRSISRIPCENNEIDPLIVAKTNLRPILKAEGFHCMGNIDNIDTSSNYLGVDIGQNKLNEAYCKLKQESRTIASRFICNGNIERSNKVCVFCKRNGEMNEFYSTHVLKDRRGIVVCPVLRAYTCPKCGSSGDHAHTESHCPRFHSKESFMSCLCNGRNSCGSSLKYNRHHQHH